MHKRKLVSFPERERALAKRLKRSLSQPIFPSCNAGCATAGDSSPKAEPIFNGMRFLLIRKGIGNVQFEILTKRIREKGLFHLECWAMNYFIAHK